MRYALVACILMVVSLGAQADQWLFYQPQKSDAALNDPQWHDIWQQSAAHGVHTVIVQWTRHGDEDFGGPQGWLAGALQDAQEEGLELVMGLAYDPAYYRVLPDTQRFATYWHQQLSHSWQQQRRLSERWQLAPVGWYLPLELDDSLFREQATRQELLRQLSDFVSRLDKPLHISAFSGGILAPSVMADWLGKLNNLGIHVWWQDGRGTQALPSVVRQAYEDALDCRIGIVREAFRQTNRKNDAFAAAAAAPNAAPACHDSAVFSLRYRPWASALVETSDIP